MTRRNNRAGAAIAGLIAATALLLAGCGVDGTPEKSSDDTGNPSSNVAIPTQPAPTAGKSGAPVTAEGSFRVSASTDVRVVVTIVEDMGCPACQAFQAAYGDMLDEISALPGAAVDYRIISFLDRMSDDEYSSRAANASYCVWNRPGDDADRQRVWLAFQTAAFHDQPDEGGKGLSDAKLAQLAQTAGAGDVEACITSGQYRADVKKTSDATLAEPSFQGTPTILVNGESMELRDAGGLLDTVKKHLQG